MKQFEVNEHGIVMNPNRIKRGDEYVGGGFAIETAEDEKGIWHGGVHVSVHNTGYGGGCSFRNDWGSSTEQDCILEKLREIREFVKREKKLQAPHPSFQQVLAWCDEVETGLRQMSMF